MLGQPLLHTVPWEVGEVLELESEADLQPCPVPSLSLLLDKPVLVKGESLSLT